MVSKRGIRSSWALAVLTVPLGAGCTELLSDLGPGTTGTTTTTTSPPPDGTGATGTTSTGTEASTSTTAPPLDDTGTTTSGGASSSSETSTGGPMSPLVSRGLLARWFIDEASDGQRPDALADAALDPVDLTIEYLDQSPAFVEDAGNRGLRWPMFGRGGRAIAAIAGTKLTALDDSTAATFELVVDIDLVPGLGSPLFFIGGLVAPMDDGGDLSLEAVDFSNLAVHWAHDEGVWVFTPSFATGRQVMHVVIDTNEAVERVRMYSNGDPLMLKEAGVDPVMGQTITIAADASAILGNSATLGQSFQGTLSYAAIYTTALSLDEVHQNVEVLMVDDDGGP